ncbi:hypothetical protein BKA56DRAFT_596269 [Ilyonectria sp. MPI-CAGE-AT-0026]|nr:hypothetical protein BKA56DRAFT_596269 [Ilyonectria sp. MPI-CAGE-AT-0026]
MEQSDALDPDEDTSPPIDRRSEQSPPDSDAAQRGKIPPLDLVTHSPKARSELEAEPKSDHDTKDPRKRVYDHGRRVDSGMQKIATSWNISKEEVEEKFGRSPSRQIIELACKFSDCVPFDVAWPRLKTAQAQRRDRNPKALNEAAVKHTRRRAKWVPRDFERAMEESGVLHCDGSSDTAVQGDHSKDEQRKTRIKHPRTTRSTESKLQNTHSKNAQTCISAELLEQASSSQPLHRAASKTKSSRKRTFSHSSLASSTPESPSIYVKQRFTPAPGVVTTDALFSDGESPSQRLETPTLSQSDAKDGLEPCQSLQETAKHSDTGQTIDVDEGAADTQMNEVIIIGDDDEDNCSDTHERQEIPPDALCTLAPDTWLNDKAVFFTLLLIVRAVADTYIVIDPILSKPESTSPIPTKPHMTVLAPINLPNTAPVGMPRNDHWILAVLYGAENRVDVYDSLINPDNTKTVRLSIEGLIHRLFPTAVLSNWNTENQPTPSQSNFDDCGVVVLVVALHLVSGRSPPALPINGQLWRRLFSALRDEGGDPAAWVQEEIRRSSLAFSLSVPTTSQPDSVLEFLGKYQAHLQNTSQQSSQLKDIQETTSQAASIANELHISALRSREVLTSQIAKVEENISMQKEEPLHFAKLLSLDNLTDHIGQQILDLSQQQLTKIRCSQNQYEESVNGLSYMMNYATHMNKAIQVHLKRLDEMRRIGDGLEGLLAGASELPRS